MNYVIILLVIFVDQVTKFMVQDRFAVNESIPIIKNIFHLTYVQNMGAAFGILQNQKMFFVMITLVVVVGILIFFKRQKNIHSFLLYSLSLILAGAVGNLTDRIRLEYVVDFFDFRVWPVFNIADISIIVGSVFLSYYMFFIEDKNC